MTFTISSRRIVFLAACMAAFCISGGLAYSQVVGPGKYKCWTPKEIIDDPKVDSKGAAELVSGFCKYQGTGINGQVGFSRLDQIPQRIIKRNAPNVVSYMEPRANLSDYTLSWWIEGDNPNEVHPANHVIGKQLQQADVRTPLTRVPTVEIRAMVFSLDQTKGREIGLNIAAHFAKAPGDDPGLFDLNAIDGAVAGLLNVVGAVSDSMAYAIRMGFSASSEKSYAREQLSITTLCPVGSYCRFEDTTENYFVTYTGTEKEELGIRFSMVPILGLESDEIKLENMQFRLGLKTDDPDAPVNTIKAINSQIHILKDGQLHVLGSELREFDSKGTQLLGKDKESIHSRMILLLRAHLKDGESAEENTGALSAAPIDRSFTKAELGELDDGIEFYDVLSSLEKVCFDDVMNPLMAEKICGFHLTKMNPAFIEYWVDIRIDSKKHLRYPENHIRSVKLGDIYQGKGYYQIPMLNDDDGRKAMGLRIELSRGGSGTDLRKTLKSKRIPVGLKLAFAYTSGHGDPVDVQTSSIEPVK